MQTKVLLSLLSGIAVGGASVYFLKSPAPQTAAEMTTKLATLQKDLDAKTAELKKWQEKYPTKAEASELVGREQAPDAAAQAEMDKMQAKIKEQQQMMKKRIEERFQVKANEQLAALKKALNLTDEQAEAVRGLILEKLKKGDFMSRAMSAGLDEESEAGGEGKSPKDLEKEMMDLMLNPMKSQQEMDAKLAALLNPDQQAAYNAHKLEQKANQVELRTNKELGKLQAAMSLTNEQKDQVFGVLSQFTAAEYEKPIPGMLMMLEKQPSELERMKKDVGEEKAAEMLSMMEELKVRQKSRRDALQPILTPEQMKVYENVQQSSAFDFSEMMGDGAMDMMMLGGAVEMGLEENPVEPKEAEQVSPPAGSASPK